jgi:SAM-dependent methyltransferase
MDSQNNPAQEIPKSEIIDEAIEWLYRIGALRAALELQLWERMVSGGKTAEELAAQEGWDPIGTRVLLDAICAQRLLKKEGDRYSLVPESDCYLIPSKPTYQGNVLLNEYHWEGNGRLADAIRSGKRPVQYDATQAYMTDIWKAYYSRGWVYPESLIETADKLWQSLEIQARNGMRVLDVACGPAPRSLALARKHPGVHLTWLDWEGVLQTALKAAGELGITKQVSFLPGDLWSVDYGSNIFDVAYLGNVTHFFGSEENTRLFRKVHAALVSGGKIVVNSAARREIDASVWDALWLYAATASGGAYDFTEYKSMLENAGFTNIEDIDKGPIRAVKA